MIVNYEDKQFVIKFEHDTLGGEMDRKTTVAKMFEILPSGERIFIDYGMTYCATCDKFNRMTGRKNALTKLLQNFEDRKFREVCWSYYFDQHTDIMKKNNSFEEALLDMLAVCGGAFEAIRETEDSERKNLIAYEAIKMLMTE